MKHFFRFIICSLLIFLFSGIVYANSEEFNGYIIKLKSDTALTFCDDIQPLYPSLGIYKADTLSDAENYEAFCEYIEPDFTVSLDEYTTYDYSSFEDFNTFSSSQALFMQKAGVYGKGVKVGVVDSGAFAHSAIKENIKGGYNYIDNTDDYTDTYGHGTAVIVEGVAGPDTTVGIVEVVAIGVPVALLPFQMELQHGPHLAQIGRVGIVAEVPKQLVDIV